MFGCCRRFISSYEFSRRKVPCQNLSFIFESFLSALPCTLHLFGDIGENTRLHFAFVHFAVQNTQFRSYKSNEVARHTHSRCEKNYLLGSFYKNTLVSLVYFDKFSSFNSAHKIMNLSRVHVQRKQRTQKRRRIRRAHCSWQSDRKHLTWIILFREYSFQLRPSHMLASASVLFKLRRAPAAIAKKKTTEWNKPFLTRRLPTKWIHGSGKWIDTMQTQHNENIYITIFAIESVFWFQKNWTSRNQWKHSQIHASELKQAFLYTDILKVNKLNKNCGILN